jgi:hypothetical protein
LTREGFEKKKMKGGAILNTNYSLELLKAYLSTLRQPNKAYFHYFGTPGIGYKCAIKFPETCPSKTRYIVGKNLNQKVKSLKSVAFYTIKLLRD